MARRPYASIDTNLEFDIGDPRFAELLEDIRQEETPERLLTLARELQKKLLMQKQRRTPN